LGRGGACARRCVHVCSACVCVCACTCVFVCKGVRVCDFACVLLPGRHTCSRSLAGSHPAPQPAAPQPKPQPNPRPRPGALRWYGRPAPSAPAARRRARLGRTLQGEGTESGRGRGDGRRAARGGARAPHGPDRDRPDPRSGRGPVCLPLVTVCAGAAGGVHGTPHTQTFPNPDPCTPNPPSPPPPVQSCRKFSAARGDASEKRTISTLERGRVRQA